MKAQSIFKKVGNILAEINEQYQYLSESKENLNDIELELLSANADFLAEHIKVLKKINISEAVTEAPLTENTEKAQRAFDEIDAGREIEDVSNPHVSNSSSEQSGEEALDSNSKDAQSDESQKNSETQPERAELKNSQPVVNSIVENIEEEKEITDVAEDKVEQKDELEEESFTTYFRPEPGPANVSEPRAKEETEEAVVNEVVIEEKTLSMEAPKLAEEPKKALTLNEMISAQMNQNATPEPTKPSSVSDIKAIINLNDKLLFIKDLFNGYSLAYSEAIELINRFESFDAADDFLKRNYSEKNNWSARQATADKFYELLNRRFAK